MGKDEYRNKRTGTVYKSADFNGTGIVEVTTQKGSKYLVHETNLEPTQPINKSK